MCESLHTLSKGKRTENKKVRLNDASRSRQDVVFVCGRRKGFPTLPKFLSAHMVRTCGNTLPRACPPSCVQSCSHTLKRLPHSSQPGSQGGKTTLFTFFLSLSDHQIKKTVAKQKKSSYSWQRPSLSFCVMFFLSFFPCLCCLRKNAFECETRC